jgi:hypothetical protein
MIMTRASSFSACSASPRETVLTLDRLPFRFLVAAFFASLLIPCTASAQTNPTGNWSGTYTYSIQVSSCQNKTFTSSGNVSATFFQIGNSLSGRIDFTNLLVFNGNCSPVNQEITSVVIGSISSTGINWRFVNDSNQTNFVGTNDGKTITAKISDVFGGTGSVTMTQPSVGAPSVDINGSWSGTYTFTDRCTNGVTVSYAGPFTLGISQSGNRAGGVVTMQNVPLYDQTCKKITTLNMALTAAGTVSGSSFSGAVYDPSGSFEFPVQAIVSNGAMSGTVQGASQTSTAGTFTLTRGNASPPATDFSGSYDGSYNEIDNDGQFCFNVGFLTFDGNASVSLVQAGTSVSGSIAFENTLSVSSDGFGNCVVIDSGEQVLPLYGTLSGNSLTLQLPIGNGASEVFSISINNGALTGTISDSFGDTASFDGTLTASASAPVINTFKSSDPIILSGQATTLTWSTTNAATVSIDNGVGVQSTSGSASVSPTQTTTYTLTATGPGGTATAKTTVTVFPPQAKRRAARS